MPAAPGNDRRPDAGPNIGPRSWIDSANAPEAAFPLANLPYGVFSVGDGARRCGVAIGDRILDATGLEAAGLLRADPAADVLGPDGWQAFMALGPAAWAGYRARLTDLLSEQAEAALRERVFAHTVPMAQARLHLPFRVAEFTDFYAGRHHAENVGTMFRGPENALPPNWLSMPIGYNGRASSVVVSGTPVRRPWGQIKDPDADLPRLAPSARFDFELELGAVVGVASDGPLSVAKAFEHIFGYVLLNDWSARDIQTWEYQPLGPFQAKATATTISPWIVPAAALAPHRRDPPPRDRPLLPHLADAGPMHYDIALEVALNGHRIAQTNARELYYSAAQQLAHHSTCGCPMRVGDLLGSGTISGPTPDSRGALLELSWGGAHPIALPDGSTRRFLEDGDSVSFTARSAGPGPRIGFGPCEGRLLPALDPPFPPP